jgi:hypothetical protein
VLPVLLLPEIEVSESGAGTPFELDASHESQLTITLEITHILQQHSLDLSILGSRDGTNWLYPPLAGFSQKFYCGTYHITLDLKGRPDVRYLLPRWKLSRWGHSAEPPLFGLYLMIEPARAHALTLGAAHT